MSRIAMKIAYNGAPFHGQARQPGLATVEGEVLQALLRAHAIRDVRGCRLQSASRTDRGVSALGNVVAFDALLPPVAAVRAFNSKARGIWAWAVADVSPTFNARRARERWYRYALEGSHDETRLRRTLSRFVGEHDFRSFTRDRERTVLRINEAVATRDGGGIVLDFRAPRFAWNLVRRLVAAALKVESERVEIREIERALQGGIRLDFGLAPPEPLVLMDVRYDIDFRHVRDLTTISRIQRIHREWARNATFYAQVERQIQGNDGVP